MYEPLQHSLFASLDGVLFALIVEVKGAIQHDLLVWVHSTFENAVIIRLRAERDLLQLELAGSELNKDMVFVVFSHDGRGRNGSATFGMVDEGHAGEHGWLENAARICQVHAHRNGACCRIDNGRYEGKLAFHLLIGEGRNFHHNMHPFVQLACAFFWDVGYEPHVREVGDHERDFGRLNNLSQGYLAL